VAARAPARQAQPSRLRQAALRVARWLHAARGDDGRCARPRRKGGAPALRAPASDRARARGAPLRRARAHHAQAAVRRRHRGGGHGPAVALVQVAASVPSPRFHTVKYAGVLAPASPWRPRIRPRPEPAEGTDVPGEAEAPKRAKGGYRAWADLLRRTFAVDVLECPTCKGRMKLVAMVADPKSITRYLAAIGEPTDVRARRVEARRTGRAPSCAARRSAKCVAAESRRSTNRSRSRSAVAPSFEPRRLPQPSSMHSPTARRTSRPCARLSRARPSAFTMSACSAYALQGSRAA